MKMQFDALEEAYWTAQIKKPQSPMARLILHEILESFAHRRFMDQMVEEGLVQFREM